MRWLVAMVLAGCVVDSELGAEDAEVPDGIPRFRDAAADGPLEVRCSGGLVAEPTAGHFGWVPTGEQRTLEVVLVNEGTCPLADVVVTGDGDFAVASLEAATAPPGDRLVAEVTFTARGGREPARGEVVATWAGGALRIPLTANDGFCADIDPIPILRAPVGGRAREWVYVGGCGGQVLGVRAVRVTHPAFRLEPTGALPRQLGRDESLALELGFEPQAAGVVEAALEIETDSEEFPVITMPLRGEAGDFCPRPVVDRPWQVTVPSVVPLQVQDANPATALGVEWAWVVVAAPPGSVSQPLEAFFNNGSPADGGLSDDVSTPGAVFFADVAGHYEIEVRARNFQGCDERDTVVIDAWPGIEVELEHPPGTRFDLLLSNLNPNHTEFCTEHDQPFWGGCFWEATERGAVMSVPSPPDDLGGVGVWIAYREGDGPAEVRVTARARGGEPVEVQRDFEAPFPDGAVEVMRVSWPGGVVTTSWP